MKVGVVGLGLIGGSFAKAYKEKGHNVYAYDIDKSVLYFAKMGEFIDEELNEHNIKECDLIFLALYPKASIEYFEKNAMYMNDATVIIDCCGTKRKLCDECFEIAEKNGLTFVGGHPMAGKHQSGFAYSRASLYKGASMVIVPKDHNDINLLGKVKNLLEPAEFGRITVTDAETHDRMIAFTSQMAHVVSNAFIKSPTAKEHKGFSAGSYKDLTRVAWLNEDMWTELFMENKENLSSELDIFIKELCKYKNALDGGNAKELKKLLSEGKKCKEEVDGVR
ncbi:MAG: prephenate dehydrogenase [Lachnospiraceae bacterium]|nr:prephenate dehydrogenase [Lachnospiraceae bacterium]